MSREKISQDLTFEQFREYADRKPSLEGNWIYHLEHIRMVDNASYPEFEVCPNDYYFLSFEDAEKYIKEKLTGGKNAFKDTYCFVISQLCIAAELWRSEGASWLYNREGKLIDYCITTRVDNPYQSRFFGRTDERLRFKKGDIVEIRDGNFVRLAMVAYDGPTVDCFWQLYIDSRDEFGYYTNPDDDCYYVIDGPGTAHHYHVPTLALMKPRFPVTKDVKTYFEHCLEVTDREDFSVEYRFAGCLKTNANLNASHLTHLELSQMN